MAEPSTKRFCDVTDNDIDKIISDRTPVKTLSANKGWLTVFNKLNDDQEDNLDLESCTKSECVCASPSFISQPNGKMEASTSEPACR